MGDKSQACNFSLLIERRDLASDISEKAENSLMVDRKASMKPLLESESIVEYDSTDGGIAYTCNS